MNNPFQKYKSASAASDDPIRKLLFVFNEVLNLLYLAKKALGERDYETKYKALKRIEDVFFILRSGIDTENGGDIMKLMDSFYASTMYNVHNANMQADIPEDLDKIVKAITNVRDAMQSEIAHSN